MTDKKFQVLDTTSIQVRSLLNYMLALGYNLDNNSKSGRFVTELPAFQGNRYLSFDTAVKLHNAKDWHVEGQMFAWPVAVQVVHPYNVLGVALAEASKLVEQVKLRITKHGDLVVLDPMVKPLNKTVERLLGV